MVCCVCDEPVRRPIPIICERCGDEVCDDCHVNYVCRDCLNSKKDKAEVENEPA